MPDATWNPLPDDENDFDDPSADAWDDELSETVPCPACGAEVYEDADQCPACGEYITADTRIWSGKPTWWIILGVLGILAVMAALLLGF
jgi:hypothetical protein